MYKPRIVFYVEISLGPNYDYHRLYPYQDECNAVAKYHHFADYLHSSENEYSCVEVYKKEYLSDGSIVVSQIACKQRVYPPKREMNHLLKQLEVAF